MQHVGCALNPILVGCTPLFLLAMANMKANQVYTHWACGWLELCKNFSRQIYTNPRRNKSQIYLPYFDPNYSDKR